MVFMVSCGDFGFVGAHGTFWSIFATCHVFIKFCIEHLIREAFPS